MCYGGGIFGAPGRECLTSAFKAQIDIEAAGHIGWHWLYVSIEYYKFFDKFEPDFFHEFNISCGIPWILAALTCDLNKQVGRRIKVNGTLGLIFHGDNGAGQGDVFLCWMPS